jgi:CBS domain-containing membrane protein
MFSIDEVMSTDLITVKPSASLAQARSLMQNNHIHHLPVVEDAQELVGLVTLTDVLRAQDSVLRKQRDRIKATDITVAEVMVTNVATVSRDASLRQAALFIEKHSIGCLPVVDDDRLIGIITDSDFVAVAINLLEQLEEFEPEEDLDSEDVA